MNRDPERKKYVTKLVDDMRNITWDGVEKTDGQCMNYGGGFCYEHTNDTYISITNIPKILSDLHRILGIKYIQEFLIYSENKVHEIHDIKTSVDIEKVLYYRDKLKNLDENICINSSDRIAYISDLVDKYKNEPYIRKLKVIIESFEALLFFKDALKWFVTSTKCVDILLFNKYMFLVSNYMVNPISIGIVKKREPEKPKVDKPKKSTNPDDSDDESIEGVRCSQQ